MSDSSDLPPGWANAAVGELLEDAKTGLVRSAKLQSDEREFPYIKMQNFDIDGEWHLDDIARVDASDDEIAKSNLKEGDVLFNTRNSTELVGKTAIWNGPEGTYLYNNNLLRMRFCPAMSQGWAAFHFRCPQFRKTLETIKSATTSVAAIYQKPLLQQNLRVPPLNEQRRIVAKIEELTARSRNAKRALDAIPPLLERFRQSVLAAAFRGDLTKQWRQQNPNTDWQKINFSELVDSFQNGLSKRRGKSGLETAVIRLADIDSQRVSRSDMRTIKLSEAEREKYSLEKNDILILRVNGSADLVGRFVLIETTDELAYCDHFIRLRVSSLVLPGWVRLLGDSFAFREHIRKATVSSAGQKTVSQKTLNSFQVALPTLEEQAVICARVASIFTFCDRVQDQVDLGCSRSERLDQSILAKAFRGELVPQDPNDEPASALLARTRERKQERPKVC